MSDPLTDNPHCLFGWGNCGHPFGHTCFRTFKHKGKCWDAGDPPQEPCESRQRPKNWDATGRAEANR